jgi:hypothetical protein
VWRLAFTWTSLPKCLPHAFGFGLFAVGNKKTPVVKAAVLHTPSTRMEIRTWRSAIADMN